MWIINKYNHTTAVIRSYDFPLHIDQNDIGAANCVMI